MHGDTAVIAIVEELRSADGGHGRHGEKDQGDDGDGLDAGAIAHKHGVVLLRDVVEEEVDEVVDALLKRGRPFPRRPDQPSASAGATARPPR